METTVQATAHTQLLAVIGHPIAHSKSPQMHQAALNAQQLPLTYLAFDVWPEELQEAVSGLRALRVRGWNVTIPHKVAIIPFLDAIDEDAREIGAVNTVVNDGGRLIGYNTDGAGYLASLREETGITLREQRVLILGAGGAARAIAYVLARAGVPHIVVANRTASRARELASFVAQWTETSALALEEVAACTSDRTLIVNTTSVGMAPHTDATPLDPRLIPAGSVVSDLIYNPAKTLLLQEAEKRGCTIHNGLGMFIRQGALAYEKWTGKPAPLDVMRSAASS
ncbi:shikimate dehydrogenase [Numidum massiliense]|uniref:shikimate dehydrogenase n=1 Tax=Numidum massiliense TaxID=1522315 RepID=UPI0006D534D8|nr:shikimate dehydrogenase [Numidum massiliense]